MGDGHGGRFARRGRTLNPPRPQVDAHRGVASRHGARAKRFAPRENALLGESLPKRREGERICAAQEHAPRRRPPDTAHGRKDLPRGATLSSAKASRHGARAKRFARAGTRPSAKASRHGARAKEFAPAREGSPRRRPPDTAHERKDLPRARTLSSAKASRHGARAKGFAPRGSRSPHVPTNGGPPSTDGQPEKHPFGEVAPETARPLPSSFTEKNKTTP